MTYVDFTEQSPAILSFCPGFLGLERGIEKCIGKLRVLAYVEIEAHIIANLVAGMEAGVLGAAPIWTDAKTFDALPFHGRVHGLIGGYPCPGESTAGLREGHLYKGFIWPSIRRAIQASRPLWCFFENVDDHLTGTYPIVLRSLYNMGYSVEAGVFDAEEVGSTCERKRLFIFAVAKSDSVRTIRELRNLLQPSAEDEGTPQRKDREWLRNGTKHSGEVVVGSNGGRLENVGLFREQNQKEDGGTSNTGAEVGQSRGAGLEEWQIESAREKFSALERAGYPMGQGYEQFPWEPPRIESSLVYNIARYNFREDLVRAVGNSVDENTAELAFFTLLEKHIMNTK
jgi:site-specific DNA-cytosine methylase